MGLSGKDGNILRDKLIQLCLERDSSCLRAETHQSKLSNADQPNSCTENLKNNGLLRINEPLVKSAAILTLLL